jgi:DNA-binding response OmpR family regulator
MAMTPINDLGSNRIPKIFVVCDRADTAPMWGYILRQQGLIVVVETNIENAIDHWSAEMPELLLIDVDTSPDHAMALCRKFRKISVAPILLFLPSYDETRIVEAYAVGVDDVLVKPVSHTIFIPKIMAWLRRTWIMPTDGLNLIKAGRYRFDPTLRCVVDPDEVQIKLTNLEFRLLYLLMSRPGHTFLADEIIQSIWGGYGNGDQVVLKNVIYRLRRKIEPDPTNPVLIQTRPGGYSFRV